MRVPFEPPPGLSSDDTPFAAPGVYEDGSNVRFWEGKPQVIGGWTDALNGSMLTGVCRNALSWKTNGGVTQIAFGTHSNLQLWQGGALYDITPAGLAEGSIDGSAEGPGWGSGAWSEGVWTGSAVNYYLRTWALGTYGDYLIANPRRGTIYQWAGNTSTAATAVTNAPASVGYTIVTPQRQVMAMGCNEEASGDFNAMCIRWSDIEDITDWTTSPANNAGEHILEGGGRIVAAANAGPYILVWTDQAVHLGTFLGDPAQTYRFDMIADGCGLIGPNAFAVLGQTVYWVSTDKEFRSMQVGGVPQLLPCPISRDFAANLATDQSDKIAAAAATQFGEVWWHYPDARDGIENSRYVTFCAQESVRAEAPVWFRGVMARTAACDAGATAYPIKATYDGSVYYHSYGVSAAGGTIDWHLKSSDFYLDKGGSAMMLRSFEPDFELLDDSVSLTIYARQYPRSEPVAHGPYTITPTATKKDFRASGRLVSVEISGSSATPTMRLGVPVFDTVQTGRR